MMYILCFLFENIILNIMTTEKTFRSPQIIPSIFAHSTKGCAMFHRFFLNRNCFKEEVEIDEKIEDYLTVKKNLVEKKNFVYTVSEMELTPEQEKKDDEKKVVQFGGVISWRI